MQNADYRILFVCMGNICRSPTAEGVFRKHVDEAASGLNIYIDSAGTHAYHTGEPPDARAQRAALRRGVDLSKLRARRVSDDDFADFDMIIVMDRLNFETLRDKSPSQFHERIRLLLDFAPQNSYEEVPDPYYGGINGFERVLDLVEQASAGLLIHLHETRRS